MEGQQKSGFSKESTGAKPKKSPGGASENAGKLYDDGREDVCIPASTSEMEIQVVTLLPPEFLWNPPSSSIEKVLLSMKMTDEPSQEKEKTSETSSDTTGTEGDKLSLARKDEPGASSTRTEKKAFLNPLNIIFREQWRARRPRLYYCQPRFPFTVVNIDYYDVPFVRPMSPVVKYLQLLDRICYDILTHFIVDSDALVYEGRGWDADWETNRFDIDIIGNYNHRLPSYKEFAACSLVIKEGVRMGKISQNYQLHSSTLDIVYLETIMHNIELHSVLQ